MNFKQAQEAAPPTPACFPDRSQWAAYLLSAQTGPRGVAVPFDARGIFNPAFNFCTDCTLAHSVAMGRKNRCNPSLFRAAPASPNAPQKVAHVQR